MLCWMYIWYSVIIIKSYLIYLGRPWDQFNLDVVVVVIINDHGKWNLLNSWIQSVGDEIHHSSSRFKRQVIGQLQQAWSHKYVLTSEESKICKGWGRYGFSPPAFMRIYFSLGPFPNWSFKKIQNDVEGRKGCFFYLEKKKKQTVSSLKKINYRRKH